MAFPNNPTSPPVLELNSHAINTSCVGFWPLTHVQGTTATDISTGGNDGTESGGVAWASTTLGNAASFDGVDDYIDIVGPPANTITQPLTLSAWVYNDPAGSGTNDLVALGKTTNDNPLGILRFTYSTGEFSAVFREASIASSISNAPSNPTGTWHHVCAVASSSTNLELFIDGVSVASDTSTNYGTLTYDNLTIGALQRTTVINHADGNVQNVRVFNTALSASDVALLYNRPWVGTDYDELWPYSPPVPSSMSLSTDTAATSLMSGCVGWWPLTEGTGNSAADVSGSSNNATGAAVSWENSTAGNAYEASGGYVQSASFPVTNVSAFSISAWIKNNATNADYLGTWSGFSGSTEKSVLLRNNVLEAVVRNAANTAEASLSSSSNLNTKASESHNGMAHCVFVVDSGTATWYINGAQVAQNLSFMAGPYIPTSNTDGLLIGEANGTTMTTGSVQNVRMWSRALTADEVSLLYERPWEGEATYGDALYNDPPPTLALGTTAEDVAINNSQEIWLPLTDGIGTTAVDISGNGNNGTLTGTSGNLPLWHVGKLGYSVAGDGTNARRVEISNTALSAVPAMSTSCWIFNDAVNNYEVYYGYGQLNYLFAFQRVATQDVLRFFTNGLTGNTDLRTPAGTLKTGVWQHVVGTYDGSTKRLYFDGVEVASASATGSITQPTSNTAILSASGSGYDVDGKVANLRVWSRALSAVEVQSLYETPWVGSNYGAVAAFYNYIFRSKRFRRL